MVLSACIHFSGFYATSLVHLQISTSIYWAECTHIFVLAIKGNVGIRNTVQPSLLLTGVVINVANSYTKAVCPGSDDCSCT